VWCNGRVANPPSILVLGLLSACLLAGCPGGAGHGGKRDADVSRDDATMQANDADTNDADRADGDAGADASADGSCAWAGYSTPLDAGPSACPDSPGATGPAEQTSRLEVAPDAGFTVHRNWTYGVRGGRTLQGDLYVPDGFVSKPGGLILGIHGGGWEDCGRRRDSGQVVNFLRRLSLATGAAVFNIEYRLSQEGGQYPENLKDVRCALQYAVSRIAASPQLGVDATRVVVTGESAGAHLALMLGLTEDRADLDPACSFAGAPTPEPNIRGVYAFSTVTDLPTLGVSDLPVAPSMQRYTNGACLASAPVVPSSCGCVSENRCADASPLHHVCRARPQMDVVLVHAPRNDDGEYDLFLPFNQAERVRDAFGGTPQFQLWIPDAQALLSRGCYGSDYIIENGVVRPDGTLIPFAHGYMECLTDAVFPLLELAVKSKVGGL
jgi:acetyl esterase/lipase